MATELLSPGIQSTLTQNVVYALPASRCQLFTTGAPTIQQANDVGFAAPVAVTLTGGQSEVSGGFIRCTSATIIITLKKV